MLWMNEVPGICSIVGMAGSDIITVGAVFISVIGCSRTIVLSALALEALPTKPDETYMYQIFGDKRLTKQVCM